MAVLVGYALAILIGLSLGLLGGGGSVLALPVLVYVVGIAPKVAVPMTLVVVGAVSLLGAIPHIRRGNVAGRAGVVFGGATMVGAYGGARLATLPFITDTVQMTLFAVAMLVAAGLMIRRRPPAPELTGPYVPPVCPYCWLWLPTEGLLVGMLTGLVGVGGGFAIVPALVLLANIPMKQAIGTSLLIIAANSLAGLAGYLGHVHLDWHLTVNFTLLAGIGTVAGAYLAQFIHPAHLQKGFGYFLLAIAALVLWQNQQPRKQSYVPLVAPAARANPFGPSAGG
ncbi:MAG: sulfite exporter TauE/SafE family protein [Gloeomargarita sp. SKYG116]|nr:sulfite exporter TauE/SafE family protein [Gloeomargarita sp. SKYG116]MDW8400729.1 sulfite exporter TauE/SafE family protein [Gloeomargarita sp. SKYGB_i_bin116]